jgi:hypothetical protein
MMGAAARRGAPAGDFLYGWCRWSPGPEPAGDAKGSAVPGGQTRLVVHGLWPQ